MEGVPVESALQQPVTVSLDDLKSGGSISWVLRLRLPDI